MKKIFLRVIIEGIEYLLRDKEIHRVFSEIRMHKSVRILEIYQEIEKYRYMHMQKLAHVADERG